MDPKPTLMTRRAALLGAVSGGLGLLIWPSSADAQKEGTTPPNKMGYVEKATNGKLCVKCKFYFGPTFKAGRCTIVSGPIEPKGTCVAYTPKLK